MSRVKMHYLNISDYFICLSSFLIVALIGMILSSVPATAETTTASASVIVGAACTLTATVNTAHTTEVPAGTSKQNIGSTTLKTICNDTDGFAIYAIGYSNDELGNNKMLQQGAGASPAEFNTGTNTTGTSSWAMKLNQVTTGTYAATIDNGYSNYSLVPATYTKIAHRDSATDAPSTSPAVGTSLNLTYQSYISTTQETGTYVGKVRFTLVHPANEIPAQPQTTPSGFIGYYPNTNMATGSMTTSSGGPVQQLTSSQTSATLLASNFSRDGYGFAGWNDKYDYSGNYYGPNEEITFTAGQYSGSNGGLSLYAVWVKSTGTLQHDIENVCGNLTRAPQSGKATMASVTALTDLRDRQTYAVARLADGRCWMIENLRLESQYTTRAGDAALSRGYGTYSGTGTNYGSFVGLANAESSGFSSSFSSNSLYSIDGSNNTININSADNPQIRIPKYNNINTASSTRATSLTASTTYSTTANASIYGYGNYYSWAAALANTIHYATDNLSLVDTAICPANWFLPQGGSVTSSINVDGDESNWRDYYTLGYYTMSQVKTAHQDTANDGNSYYSGTVNANGDTATKAFRKFPNNFVYSGRFNGNAVGNRGGNGYYWTATPSTNGTAYRFVINETNVYPGTNNDDKFRGFAVRCFYIPE
ncbi:hypothetical protein IKD49_01155 [Candidatus Saccharibacteria bacterium]|nr:hypothetical protein [Candidatus Saccharibacteria bacterium]